jgi:hypothetical protein
MTADGAAQIITSIGSLIAACGSTTAVVMAVINRRGIQEVKKATDGMKSELVSAVKQNALAAGHAQGETKGHALGLEQGRHEERPAPTEGL